MNHHSNYTALDLAQDDQFIQWIKYPDKDIHVDLYWRAWLAENPHKEEVVEEAKRYILAIVSEGDFAQTATKQQETWERLKISIGETKALKEISWWQQSYRVAAAVLLIFCSSAVIWWIVAEKDTQPLVELKTDFIKEINNGQYPKTIVLSDGSSIVLQPNSTLEYPKTFKSEFRDVILTGEAFFEVAKDPQKPFLVYADKLVTKVLGTSFIIRAFADEQDVLVQVKTGKVSVLNQSEIKEADKENPHLEGVLLAPNQQVVFLRSESRMVKSLVENPDLLSPAVKQSFVFHDATLKDVFDSLEKAYGIDIIYEEDLMGNCRVNVSLEDMPLYDKMRLLCKVISAKYEILDSHIIVSGKGCRD